MYEIIYEDGLYWITYNGNRLEDLGGFIDYESPRVILEEIQDEV